MITVITKIFRHIERKRNISNKSYMRFIAYGSEWLFVTLNLIQGLSVWWINKSTLTDSVSSTEWRFVRPLERKRNISNCSCFLPCLRFFAYGSEWQFGFVWDSSASRAEGENRKFIIGKSIFSIWIWVYPFNARRSRLRPLNDCFGLKEILRLRLWMTIRVCLRFFGLRPLNDVPFCHIEQSEIPLPNHLAWDSSPTALNDVKSVNADY